jgi:hypothetical protein
MKNFLLVLFFLMLSHCFLFGQVTYPVIKANFGVDAELTANYFNNLNTGSDDWFMHNYTGVGQYIIDTTGAAYITNRYIGDANFRMTPFGRTMSYPAFSTVNNRLLLDAVFQRDHHGIDSTAFQTGASKNGMSPQFWVTNIQNIPNKDDILDAMAHVRREGPNTTDSLWIFGGISIENTTGDRYFDFELYQTDIAYNQSTNSFTGYGPDAGHTSWKFDAAGNVISPGDLTIAADFNSSSISSLEVRIWLDSVSWHSVNPAAFSWAGTFDGAASGALYGYAGILPKNGGTFYYGAEQLNTGKSYEYWAGPFELIRVDNNIYTDYIPDQYMEWALNLTKVGLDPASFLGGNACARPFRKMIVKTRSSTSFASALKDFVAPFSIFNYPQAKAATNLPAICDSGSVSTLYVSNPISTSTYVWSTTNGYISGSNTGTSINVTKPGTYYVTQTLHAGCPTYATDSITVTAISPCKTLQIGLTNFNGTEANNVTRLNWTVQNNSVVKSFDVERSTDGINFVSVQNLNADPLESSTVTYTSKDPVAGLYSGSVYYRLRIYDIQGMTRYSRVIWLPLNRPGNMEVTISPNPTKDAIHLTVYSSGSIPARVSIYDQMGRLLRTNTAYLQAGSTPIDLNGLSRYGTGIYQVLVSNGNESVIKRVVVVK